MSGALSKSMHSRCMPSYASIVIRDPDEDVASLIIPAFNIPWSGLLRKHSHDV